MWSRDWTELEKRQLREMMELHISVSFIARSLNRTEASVRDQAWIMGLREGVRDHEDQTREMEDQEG
jgi:hypothetical protein